MTVQRIASSWRVLAAFLLLFLAGMSPASVAAQEPCPGTTTATFGGTFYPRTFYGAYLGYPSFGGYNLFGYYPYYGGFGSTGTSRFSSFFGGYSGGYYGSPYVGYGFGGYGYPSYGYGYGFGSPYYGFSSPYYGFSSPYYGGFSGGLYGGLFGSPFGFGSVPGAVANPASSTAVPDLTISMVPGAYQPAVATIALGQTVRWTNNDPIDPHTATSRIGLWDSGCVTPGQSYAFTFNTRGFFTYYCAIHGHIGSITVT